MPTNPSQVASNWRHFATIGGTVPTKPARSIRILGDDNIGRMSDGQHLLERKLPALLRESKYHPIGAQLDRFRTGAAELGYADGPSKGMASQVAVRVLIQRRTLGALTPADFAEFEAAGPRGASPMWSARSGVPEWCPGGGPA